jgi:hypothetical protein
MPQLMPKDKSPGTPKPPGRTKPVPIRIPPRMLAVLDAMAASTNRPRSNLIIFLLGEYLKQTGRYDPTTDRGPKGQGPLDGE